MSLFANDTLTRKSAVILINLVSNDALVQSATLYARGAILLSTKLQYSLCTAQVPHMTACRSSYGAPHSSDWMDSCRYMLEACDFAGSHTGAWRSQVLLPRRQRSKVNDWRMAASASAGRKSSRAIKIHDTSCMSMVQRDRAHGSVSLLS